MDEFNRVDIWTKVAGFYAEAREKYRAAFAKAYLESTQKTGDARKYEADAATSELRLSRDKLEIEAAAAWQNLLIHRGRIEGAANPQVKFGDD